MSPSDLPVTLSSRVAVDPSGCWLFTGPVNNAGYARVDWQGARYMAHRLAYLTLADPTFRALVGSPHVGLQLDHLCGVRNCVNPDHLEPVTHAENHRRRTVRNPIKHGTYAGYARRCRCDECREANRVYHAQYRARAEAAA